MAQNTLRSIRHAKSAAQTGAVSSALQMAAVHPKPLLPASVRAELSREVRIALDGLATRGVTSPRRTVRNSHASGTAPFICG